MDRQPWDKASKPVIVRSAIPGGDMGHKKWPSRKLSYIKLIIEMSAEYPCCLFIAMTMKSSPG